LAGGVVTLTVSAAAGADIASSGLVLVVAVSVTDVAEVALAGTLICAWSTYVDGVISVPRSPSSQLALPFPVGHSPVNVALCLDGIAVSQTVTSGAEPFCADTVIVNEAACPRAMLGSTRCTLTHSSTAEGLGDGVATAEAVPGADGDGMRVAGGISWHWEVEAVAGAACIQMAIAASPTVVSTVARKEVLLRESGVFTGVFAC
jgi:hypothetical protein